MLKVGDLVGIRWSRYTYGSKLEDYDAKIVHIIPAGEFPNDNELKMFFELKIGDRNYIPLATRTARVNRYVVENQKGGYLVFPEVALNVWIFKVHRVLDPDLYGMMKKAEEQRNSISGDDNPLPKPSPRHIRMEEDSREKKKSEKTISLAEMLMGLLEEDNKVCQDYFKDLENLSDAKLIEKVRGSILAGYNPEFNELVVRFKRYKREANDGSWIGKEDMGR